jgi:xanthine dehydrogenase accessory factor
MNAAWLDGLLAFASAHGAAVRVVVVRADGSTPREVGAAMLVARNAIEGTIGGGALEHAAIGEARQWMGAVGRAEHFAKSDFRAPAPAAPDLGRAKAPARGPTYARLVCDFPLGPELGQCCGGYVSLLLELFAEPEIAALSEMRSGLDRPDAIVVRPLASGTPIAIVTNRKEARAWPLAVLKPLRQMLSGARPREALLVDPAERGAGWLIEPAGRSRHTLYLYGAGHVGRALVKALADLPFDIVWLDTAADRFPSPLPASVRIVLAAEPAAAAAAAPPGAIHLVMTFSHALDFEICRALLTRNAFRHLGLIGSATKRARFVKRLAESGIPSPALARLQCPIGMPGVPGKEPAMIAASVAADLVRLVHASAAGSLQERAHGR